MRAKFVKNGLTAYELHLIKSLGDIACTLLSIEDKLKEIIAPANEALNFDFDRSIYSQAAEECIEAITDCIPLDDRVADKIFETIFIDRNVDRAIALLSEYMYNQ